MLVGTFRHIVISNIKPYILRGSRYRISISLTIENFSHIISYLKFSHIISLRRIFRFILRKVYTNILFRHFVKMYIFYLFVQLMHLFRHKLVSGRTILTSFWTTTLKIIAY